MKKTIYLAAAALLALCLIFASCSGKSQDGLTFTVALSEDIRAVDAGVAWNYVTNQVTNQITEGLVTFDANNNIVPELAKSWHQPDEITYVYDVRDDIVFSDGSKMTMDDVLFSFERSKDPEGGTYFADFFADVESFTVDDWQFIIRLNKPSAVFKFVPATGAGRIISKAYYEEHADDFGTAAGGILATGPFEFKSWTSGQEIILKKNVNYWNKEKLEANIVDNLVFRIIPEDTTRIIALQTGNADFCANLPQDQLELLASDAKLNLSSVNSHSLTYLALNTQRPPMNDVNVRRAISRAMDISEFQKRIIGRAGAAGTILPFGPALYGENTAMWQEYLLKNEGYTLDLEAARRHLASSAYPNGFTCDLVVSENSLVNQRALYIQEALKAININVNIRRMSGDEQDTHQIGGALDANGFRDYDMLIGGWESDYPDLNGNISIMYAASHVDGSYNAAAYVNPRVDALIEEQQTTLDSAKRFEIQSRMMDIIVSDVPYIVFDYTYRLSVLNNKYSGLAVTSSWLWVLPVQNVRAAK